MISSLTLVYLLLFIHGMIKRRFSSMTTPHFIVYVEWKSRVNFVTIFSDLYQNKLWGNNFNQFTHLSSESGPTDGVIKMAAKVLFMHLCK